MATRQGREPKADGGEKHAIDEGGRVASRRKANRSRRDMQCLFGRKFHRRVLCWNPAGSFLSARPYYLRPLGRTRVPEGLPKVIESYRYADSRCEFWPSRARKARH